MFWCWLNTPQKAVIHVGPIVVFNFLRKVFLEALKVTQQCKVASSVARDPGYAVLPPSLAIQSQCRTLGNEPKQDFIICSPCRQVPQSLPSRVCHHHLRWHRPNSNIGACHSVRLLKRLCTGKRSHNSLTSSRLLTASWTIRGPLTLCLKLKAFRVWNYLSFPAWAYQTPSSGRVANTT